MAIRLLLVILSVFITCKSYGNNPSVVLQLGNPAQTLGKFTQNRAPSISSTFKATTFPADKAIRVTRNTNGDLSKEDLSNDSVLLENPRSAIFNPRDITPNRLFSADLSRPISFISSNNMIRKAGSFYQAIGEVIHLKGMVTDSFGVPISGAVVDVWQTNSAGKYQSLLEKNSEFMDVNFNMSGRAVTDNLGNYHFLTVMPGSYLNRSPHINMNIYHKSFAKIETEIYFENHPKNFYDHEYLSYNDHERKLLTSKVRLSDIFNKRSNKICSFDIVMDGVHKYKSFGGV
jgi:protocatechuate 3,4-dioxygenase beta subunit